MKFKKLNLLCSSCSRGRLFHFETAAELRSKLRDVGYVIGSEFADEIFLGKLGMPAGCVPTLIGSCPSCRGSFCWADAAGIGFEPELLADN